MKLANAVATIALALALNERASGQSCQLYAAALDAIGSKPDNTMLVEKTAMGVPTFAFYSGVKRGDTALVRVHRALRLLNKKRVAVPNCLVDSLGWKTIADSTLFRIFSDDDAAWTTLRKEYPRTPRFALLSRAIIVADTAIIYVANATGDLTGKGMIVRLVRNADGRWIRKATLLLWVS
ncbi:MAG TPA: hypothetical protein VJR92_13210 [Gemmatimonadaceae bacterium]|nr:hypothetical protein [Gemmatimonadaceae bacterium]